MSEESKTYHEGYNDLRNLIIDNHKDIKHHIDIKVAELVDAQFKKLKKEVNDEQNNIVEQLFPIKLWRKARILYAIPMLTVYAAVVGSLALYLILKSIYKF